MADRSIDSQVREHTIYKVTFVGFVLNIVLSVLKLIAGILGRSSAMVADALHSFSDFATDLIVILFVKVSSKPKDKEHDYGHGKYETLATIIIGLALALVGFKILYESGLTIYKVIAGREVDIARPGVIAIIAAGISIVVKEWMFRYTRAAGRKVESSALQANAWHHRSDAFSSVGTLIGVGGAYFLGQRWRVLDPIAAFVVGCMIVVVAFKIISEGTSDMLEKSLPDEIEDEILGIIGQDPRVSKPHNLKTRRVGPNIVIDVHLRVDPEMTVREAHQITVDVEHNLKARFGSGTMASLHVEPTKEECK